MDDGDGGVGCRLSCAQTVHLHFSVIYAVNLMCVCACGINIHSYTVAHERIAFEQIRLMYYMLLILWCIVATAKTTAPIMRARANTIARCKNHSAQLFSALADGEVAVAWRSLLISTFSWKT